MVGTPRGLAYVPMVGTYGTLVFGLPYVPVVGTGCPHGGYGILFFAAAPARDIHEWCAVPFLEISGRQMCAVGKIGETIFRSDPIAVTAEEPLSGLAQKPVVLIFGKPAHNRTLDLVPIEAAAARQDRWTWPLFRSSLRSQPRISIQSSLAPGDMARQAGAFRIALGTATNGPLLFRLRFMKFPLVK
jgi:hypothetical protein